MKGNLRGKRVCIVGSNFYSGPYRRSIEEAGGSVAYPETNPEALIPSHVEGVARDILAAEPRPDVVMLFQPQMYMQESAGGTFAESPVIKLAEELKKAGIPTLVYDDYSAMDLAKETRLRAAGAMFKPVSQTEIREVISLLGYMANNKEKLTQAGTARTG